jgi:hypothetical protein
MPIVSIIITLVVIGVALWLIGLIPMDPTIKSIIHGIIVICVVLWLISLFVPASTLNSWGIHRVR